MFSPSRGIYFNPNDLDTGLLVFRTMKKAQFIRPLLFPFALGMALGSTWAQQPVTADQRPAAFVYVKAARQQVEVKCAGQQDWSRIQKFARLFPGDSLKIPARVKILLGDGSSAWKELTGPSVIIIQKQEKSESRLPRFVENLLVMFLKDPHRRVSKEGVRNTETLLLTMPDTVFAFALPDTLRWIKNVPWWTIYRVQITRNHEILSDTLVRGNTFRLNTSTKRWQQPGNYRVKVSLQQSPLLGTEADSSVIHVLQASQTAQTKGQLEKLKKRLEQRGRSEDYFKLADFCLAERLNLELEHYLIAMAKKFPENPEPKIMLYSYYAAFLPEQVAERWVMNQLDELR